ncbi:hypothetical protein [Thalassospira sp.]|uniref:hypothetical protein n=1 Tax=Thalassospira sp. TaxID=1912094 RepID=UPI003AA91BE2
MAFGDDLQYVDDVEGFGFVDWRKGDLGAPCRTVFCAITIDQIGRTEIQLEEPILNRRDRTPVISVRSHQRGNAAPRGFKAAHGGISAADCAASGRISH